MHAHLWNDSEGASRSHHGWRSWPWDGAGRSTSARPSLNSVCSIRDSLWVSWSVTDAFRHHYASLLRLLRRSMSTMWRCAVKIERGSVRRPTRSWNCWSQWVFSAKASRISTLIQHSPGSRSTLVLASSQSLPADAGKCGCARSASCREADVAGCTCGASWGTIRGQRFCGGLCCRSLMPVSGSCILREMMRESCGAVCAKSWR